MITSVPSGAYFGRSEPEKKKNTHDILILGWDDDFPAGSFASDPGRDGAWICQNTWGEDFADAGIFYVSYEDANFVKSGFFSLT